MEPTCTPRERNPNRRPIGSVAKRLWPDHPADDDDGNEEDEDGQRARDCAAAAAMMMMMMTAADETSQRLLGPPPACPTTNWPAVAPFRTIATSTIAATVAGTARNRAAVADVAAVDCSRLQPSLQLDTHVVLDDLLADICSYDTLFYFFFF